MLSPNIRVKKSVDDIWPVSGKRVLVRADFNVPIRDGAIDSDYCIRSAIPTIRRIVDQGGICILMAHLGQPSGVDKETIGSDAQKKRASQHTQGKTALFSSLSGEEKALILSWSSMKEKAAGMQVEQSSGKTAVFSRLSEEEKKALLSRFMTENKERFFPQLSSSAGFVEEYSLQIVAVRLAELLGQHVYFAHDCLRAKQEVMKLRCGEVMLLENVRFYSNECSDDEEKRMQMANILASYGDIFVNDAFGSCHQESATMTGIPRIMGHGSAGYLVEREIMYFTRVLNNPPRPLVAIVGGARISEKLKILEHLLTNIDFLIVGGGLAYTFLKAQGFHVGSSLCEDEYVTLAQSLLKRAQEGKVKVFLPLDHICSLTNTSDNEVYLTSDANIPAGYAAKDIGPKTVKSFVSVISSCKSVIWNGPLGSFEVPEYAKGTLLIAAALGDGTTGRGLLSIVSGGDSVAAVERSGEANRMSHVSTGGIASLQLLEGRILPGIDVLDDK